MSWKCPCALSTRSLTVGHMCCVLSHEVRETLLEVGDASRYNCGNSHTCMSPFNPYRKAGMNLEDSMALIRQKQPTAEPIPAFVAQLQEYEQKCIALGVISKQSKRKVEVTDESNIPTKKRVIGPAIGPPKRAIGPSLPPFKGAGKKVDDATGTSEKNAPSGVPRPHDSGAGTPEVNGDNIRMEHQRDREVADEGKGTSESRSPIIGPIPAPPRTG